MRAPCQGGPALQLPMADPLVCEEVRVVQAAHDVALRWPFLQAGHTQRLVSDLVRSKLQRVDKAHGRLDVQVGQALSD